MKNKNDLLTWIQTNSSIIDDCDDFMEQLEFEVENNNYLPSLSKYIKKLIKYYDESCGDWDQVKDDLINLLFD